MQMKGRLKPCCDIEVQIILISARVDLRIEERESSVDDQAESPEQLPFGLKPSARPGPPYFVFECDGAHLEDKRGGCGCSWDGGLYGRAIVVLHSVILPVYGSFHPSE